MYGRPKDGMRPQCSKMGPCMAVRVRASNTKHTSAQCRNCAKPIAQQSLASWLRAKIGSQTWPKSMCTIRKQFASSKVSASMLDVHTIIACANFVNSTISVESPNISQFGLDVVEFRKWMAGVAQLSVDVDETFVRFGYCVQDFIFCARHSTHPSFIKISSLLDNKQFQAATNCIKKFEQKHGQRLVHAREYYNRRVRQHNNNNG